MRLSRSLFALLLLAGCTDYEALARESLEEEFSEVTMNPGDGEHTYAFTGYDEDGDECDGTIEITADAVQIGGSSWSSHLQYNCHFPHDRDRLEQVCRDGNADACGYAAQEWREDDPTRAAQMGEIGCQHGNGHGCFHAGVVAEQGLGEGEPDIAHAYELYRDGCRHGNRTCCFNSGLMVLRGEGTTANPATALARFERNCESEGALQNESCVEVASLLFVGAEDVERDHPRALRLTTAACEGDHLPACAQAAAILAQGEGVEHDLPRAVSLARRACDGEVGLGCRNLGVFTERGEGVERDAAAARQLFERACELGDRPACEMG